MGGAATVLGLAQMIMEAKLAVRLRVLIPAVENAIAGNAFRPGDILRSRKGITVEIGNTDAEGRLVLGDALALADEEAPDLLIDGFVGPGHVSTVIGTRTYGFVPGEYGRPLVVSGFEPLDILQSLAMVLRQLAEGRAEVENQYTRVVRPDGNPRALAAMAATMTERETLEWRGLGFIERSALGLSPAFADYDAERRFPLPGARVADPKACQCGEVLRGAIKPWECRVFGTACTPEQPIGTCMVSSEGACAAYYNYGRVERRREPAPA